MRKQIIIVLALASLVASCGSAPREEQHQEIQIHTAITDAEAAFLMNLASLCGNSYSGRQVYMQEGRESWADRNFVMHVTVCEDDRVYIPFHLDEDHSRTWMFINEEGRLRFRHDHRHEDGTPEDTTLYGGYADGNGTAFKQHFPADDYTVDLLSDTLARQWNVVLAEDMSNFSYQLQYKGEIVFQADFDLTRTLQ